MGRTYFRAGIDSQVMRTTLIAQHAVSAELSERLSALATAATIPGLAEFADGTAKMRGSLLAGDDADCDFVARAAADRDADDVASTASWRGGRLFQCYFVIYVTVQLLNCEFDSSALELIGKDLAGSLGFGGLTIWYLAGAIYDRIFGRPE
jgi:hypothetical protein